MVRRSSLLIVTATLGRSRYLEEVYSGIDILAGRVPITHILVAPNTVAAELRSRRPNAIVIAEGSGNLGLYAALNAGAVAASEWEWMTYINDDDRLSLGIEAAWRIANSDPLCDVIYGDVDYLDHGGSIVAPFPICRRPADIPALLASGIAPFTQQGALLNARLWRKLGGFDASLRLAADFDFWVRAACTGARFRYVAEKVAEFRIIAGQLSGDVESVSAEISKILRCSTLRVGLADRTLALTRFRVANAPRIFVRMLRTGRARTRGLLAGGES